MFIFYSRHVSFIHDQYPTHEPYTLSVMCERLLQILYRVVVYIIACIINLLQSSRIGCRFEVTCISSQHSGETFFFVLWLNAKPIPVQWYISKEGKEECLRVVLQFFSIIHLRHFCSASSRWIKMITHKRQWL